MTYSAQAGFDPERLQCGMPLLYNPRTGSVHTCGSYLVEWVPVVHVRWGPSEEDQATAVMGGLVMCSPCRLTFSLDSLFRTPMWALSMRPGLAERIGRDPKRSEIELEFISASDFVRESTSR